MSQQDTKHDAVKETPVKRNINLDFKIAGSTIVATVAIIAAAGVAASGHDGWGWLIFIALLAML